MTIEELCAAASGFVDANQADMETLVMIDVAGRWTGIKGLSLDAEGRTLFIETKD